MKSLALLGGDPVRKEAWPKWPVSDENEEKALLKVLHSGNWWRHSFGQGVALTEDEAHLQSTVARFQHEFAQYRGCEYGICAANGTVTIEMALRAAGIKPGDEVIVPAYTYIATASSVLMVGAVPIFVDIDPNTYNIDPQRIEEAITERTRAIIPVHFGGQPCDMERICQIAHNNNCVVIEDAAHAHGSSYQNKPVGSLGELASFSFQNSKPVTAGEGGIITTNDEKYAEIIESLLWAGRKKGEPWYRHYILASNYRMTEFQGAILSEQLKRLDSQIDVRMDNGRYLDGLLSEIEGVSPLDFQGSTTRHTFHVYMFRYDPKAFANKPKERFISALIAEGITGVMGGYTNALYQNPVFLEKNFMGGSYPVVPSIYPQDINFADFEDKCPVTERACRSEAVWVLQNMLMGKREDMEDIYRAIKKIQTQAEKL